MEVRASSLQVIGINDAPVAAASLVKTGDFSLVPNNLSANDGFLVRTLAGEIFFHNSFISREDVLASPHKQPHDQALASPYRTSTTHSTEYVYTVYAYVYE